MGVPGREAANCVENLTVLSPGSMGEVQPGHIHAVLDEPLKHIRRTGSGANGANDFGSRHGLR